MNLKIINLKHPSSFTTRMSNVEFEIEEIQNFVKKEYSLSYLQIKFPEVGLPPVNEYNTKGLFDINFQHYFP